MPPRPHLVAHPGLKAAGRLAVGRLTWHEPPETPREAPQPPAVEARAGTRQPWPRARCTRGLLLLAVGCEVAVLLLIASIADRGLAGIRESAWPLALLALASLVCSRLGHMALRDEQQADSDPASTVSTRPR